MAAMPASARTVLVIAPHPDDETILAGGRIHAGVLAGDAVKVVVVTNGDLAGRADTGRRQAESVAAARVLGLTEEDVIFLGYGDQLLWELCQSASPSKVFVSRAGASATYGDRGRGGAEYHRARTGVSAPYSREAILADLRALVLEFRPDDIFTSGQFESHGDHVATARLVREALTSLKAKGSDVRTVLHEGMVWAPVGGACSVAWPRPGSPDTPLERPRCLDEETTLDWNRVERFLVPRPMQAESAPMNLKHQALRAYKSQFSDFLAAFVRKDELFWRWDFGTLLSATARVTASSEHVAAGGRTAHAIDGLADRNHEWLSAGQLKGAWIRLEWPTPVRVGEVILHDRFDRNDNVLAGTLRFSDGAPIHVGALPPDGKPMSVTFRPRTVRWISFTIDAARGYNAGLAEIEVLGVRADERRNTPPHLVRGPVASPEAVAGRGSSTVTVEAHDLDGDALTYEWSTEAGTIEGRGASAVFTAPTVARETSVAVNVRVLDGRGGVASNTTFVRVRPGESERR